MSRRGTTRAGRRWRSTRSSTSSPRSPRGGALELAIGTGRIALPLAARGVRVAGIDLSPDMVAQLRPSRRRRDPGRDRRHGDDARRRRVLARVPRLQHDHQRHDAGRAGRVLRERRRAPRARRLLRRGGRRPATGSRSSVFDLSDTHVGVDEFDFATQRLVSHHFSLVDGGWRGSRAVPLVSPAELDLMARLAGMELRERWADWDRSPFTAESTKHISVWEKSTAMKIELPIETERLVIRPLERDDAEDLGESEEWIRERSTASSGTGGWASGPRRTGEWAGGRARRLAVGADRRPPRARPRLRRRGRREAAWLRNRGVGGNRERRVRGGRRRLTAMRPPTTTALHVLEKLEFTPQGETTFEGRQYAFFVRQR